MKVVATFTITSVVSAHLSLLWQSVRQFAGVSRTEFDEYFAGLDCGNAIWIGDPIELRRPVLLQEIRSIWPGFHPPQGFRYLSSLDYEQLIYSDEKRRAA
jgi:predicted transcriptional regulator